MLREWSNSLNFFYGGGRWVGGEHSIQVIKLNVTFWLTFQGFFKACENNVLHQYLLFGIGKHFKIACPTEWPGQDLNSNLLMQNLQCNMSFKDPSAVEYLQLRVKIYTYLHTSLALENVLVRITSGAIHAYVPAALIRVVVTISLASPKSVIFNTFSKFPSSILFKSKTEKKKNIFQLYNKKWFFGNV